MHPNSTSNPSFHLQLKPSPSLAPNPRCSHSSFDLGLNKPLTQPFNHTRGIISFLGRSGCPTQGLCRLRQSLNPCNSVRSYLYGAPCAVTAAREMVCELAGCLPNHLPHMHKPRSQIPSWETSPATCAVTKDPSVPGRAEVGGAPHTALPDHPEAGTQTVGDRKSVV